MAKKENEGKLEVNKTNEINGEGNENEFSAANQTQKDPSQGKKPSDEEVAAAKKEFEDAIEDFNNGIWQVGEEKDAQQITDYLVNFIHNKVFWYKDGWQGVLKFNEEIQKRKDELNNGDRNALELTWQALEFIFHSMSNPGGIGLESARLMQEENETYTFVMEKVGESLQTARDTLNNIENLQQKWASMSQGFYWQEKDGPEPKKQEQSEEQSEENQEKSE